MAGKGDADSRSPDLRAREDGWERIFRKLYSTRDMLEALEDEQGLSFTQEQKGVLHRVYKDGEGRISYHKAGPGSSFMTATLLKLRDVQQIVEDQGFEQNNKWKRHGRTNKR